MGEEIALRAGEGLTLFWHDTSGRIAWHHSDWLGPLGLQLGDTGESGPAAVLEMEHFAGRDALGSYAGLRFTAGAGNEFKIDLRPSVRAYREHALLVFRLEAGRALGGLATGSFERPAVAWPVMHPAGRAPGGLPETAFAFGHLYMEFGLPTFLDARLETFRIPPPPHLRPSVVEPLALLDGEGRCLLLAPLAGFHELVLAVPRTADDHALGLRAGWHGDLDHVPAGFATELAMIAAPGVRAAEALLGQHLRALHGPRRRSRHADDAVGRLSYWTDNGAAYWYRREPELTVEETLVTKVDELRELAVPIRAVELDSWFYPHATTRTFSAIGVEAPEDVPPTGCIVWEPRADILPGGIAALRQRLGGAPLILHARHHSSRSPYVAAFESFVDRERAHPREAAFFDAMCAQAAAWGAIQIEQDWLVEIFLGVRGLRDTAGTARRWQRDFDAAAERHGLSLLWCMATPADALQAVELGQIAAIRTSGDYRYIAGARFLWWWFLIGNAFARALGLLPYKDVFLSDPTGTGLDGDAGAATEALLAALSAGPVGIGDRIGRTDPAIVARVCRADGVLVKPDVPLAALDSSFHPDVVFGDRLMLASTHVTHAAGRWGHLVALHVSQSGERLRARVRADEMGDDAPYATGRPGVWGDRAAGGHGVTQRNDESRGERGRSATALQGEDWRALDVRARRLVARSTDGTIEIELGPAEAAHLLLCPVLAGGWVVFGDLGRDACLGDRRIGAVEPRADGLEILVVGALGEQVVIEGQAPGGGLPRASRWAPEGEQRLGVRPGSVVGSFAVDLDLGARGFVRLRLRPEASDGVGAAS